MSDLCFQTSVFRPLFSDLCFQTSVFRPLARIIRHQASTTPRSLSDLGEGIEVPNEPGYVLNWLGLAGDEARSGAFDGYGREGISKK